MQTCLKDSSPSPRHSSTPTPSNPPPSKASRTSFPNAFRPGFLLQAGMPELSVDEAPAALGRGGRWSGPWDVEPIDVSPDRGAVWAVARRGEPVADGGRAVAVLRERPTAHLVAAALPALAIPNHRAVSPKTKRLGVPLHDGRRHLGHLARPEPALVHPLHAARCLLLHTGALAHLLQALPKDELATLGRLLMRRVEART